MDHLKLPNGHVTTYLSLFLIILLTQSMYTIAQVITSWTESNTTLPVALGGIIVGYNSDNGYIYGVGGATTYNPTSWQSSVIRLDPDLQTIENVTNASFTIESG